jgi:hypothetical protein
MTAEGTGKDENAAAAGDDAIGLRGLANEFLDLWQANLLAWGTDPALFPSLPSMPGQMPRMPEMPIAPPPPEKTKKRRPRKPAPKKAVS